jgi:hypothetical protein
MVLAEQPSKAVAAMHEPLILADDGWTGWWIRRFQPERPVRTMGVGMVDADSQHPLQLSWPGDQPVQQTSGKVEICPVRTARGVDPGLG